MSGDVGIYADDADSQEAEFERWRLVFADIRALRRQILEIESLPGSENARKADRLRGDVAQLEATVGAPPEQWRASEPRIVADLHTVQWDSGVESYKVAIAASIAKTGAPAVAASDGPAIPKNQRPGLLTPLIEKAQRGETDPLNAAVIWPKLCDMAEQKAKPFLGQTEDGLQWKDGKDEVQYFTLKMLRDRLARQAKRRDKTR
jgi:hypothetical protein